VTLDQLAADVLQYVPAGLGVTILLFVLSLAIRGNLHFDSEVDGLRQDKADLLAINKEQAAALAGAMSTISDQNDIIRDGLRGRSGR
jgi:hypothetical protein